MPTVQHSADDVGVPSKYRIRGAWDHDLVIENSVRDGRNVVLFLVGEVNDLE